MACAISGPAGARSARAPRLPPSVSANRRPNWGPWRVQVNLPLDSGKRKQVSGRPGHAHTCRRRPRQVAPGAGRLRRRQATAHWARLATGRNQVAPIGAKSGPTPLSNARLDAKRQDTYDKRQAQVGRRAHLRHRHTDRHTHRSGRLLAGPNQALARRQAATGSSGAASRGQQALKLCGRPSGASGEMGGARRKQTSSRPVALLLLVVINSGLGGAAAGARPHQTAGGTPGNAGRQSEWAGAPGSSSGKFDLAPWSGF